MVKLVVIRGGDKVLLTATDVTTATGSVAGFTATLVTDRSHALGHVWTAGGVWHWRSPSGRNFGERQKKLGAVEALRDAFAVHRKRPTAAPTQDSFSFAKSAAIAAAKPAPAPRPQPAVAPTPVVQEVKWADAPIDLTAAIGAALRRAGGRS